jgi:hypothetical protein
MAWWLIRLWRWATGPYCFSHGVYNSLPGFECDFCRNARRVQKNRLVVRKED